MLQRKRGRQKKPTPKKKSSETKREIRTGTKRSRKENGLENERCGSRSIIIIYYFTGVQVGHN